MMKRDNGGIGEGGERVAIRKERRGKELGRDVMFGNVTMSQR